MAPLAGRWLDDEAPATLDAAVPPEGATALASHGLPFEPSVQADGRIGTVRGMTPLALRAADAGTLEVEMDAGRTATCRRVADGAMLPDGLAGACRSQEMAAAWTLAEGEAGLHVTGAGSRNRPCPAAG